MPVGRSRRIAHCLALKTFEGFFEVAYQVQTSVQARCRHTAVAFVSTWLAGSTTHTFRVKRRDAAVQNQAKACSAVSRFLSFVLGLMTKRTKKSCLADQCISCRVSICLRVDRRGSTLSSCLLCSTPLEVHDYSMTTLLQLCVMTQELIDSNPNPYAAATTFAHELACLHLSIPG